MTQHSYHLLWVVFVGAGLSYFPLFHMHARISLPYSPGSVSVPALQIPPSPGEHEGEARCRQPANAALFMRAADCSLGGAGKVCLA